ncbi:MAG TPA: outer membrane beta-barrel protein [Cyclobacteriaceae bacterium]|nr:outer membrane beta-barrel protein [Cyclobacteriaceae bacterium]
MRSVAFIFFVLLGTSALAQMDQSILSVGWNTIKPLSDKEFTNKTSSAGMKLGYSKLMNDRFGFGIEGGFNTLDDYVPRQTYEYPGGAVTTDIYNYLYYYTLMGNAQYYFVQTKNFVPYVSVAIGVAFSEYRTYYNVYSDADNNASFAVRPEIGTLFRMKENARVGLKTAASYDYAANKSSYFEVDNFSGISFHVGLVIFSE